MSIHHQLRWDKTPKALVRATPWGWRSCCTCGWVQDDGGLMGREYQARRAWKAHLVTTKWDDELDGRINA